MEPERCWQALESAWTHKRHICRHIYKQTQETSQIRMCTVEGMHTYEHRHISGETYLHKYYPSQNTHTRTLLPLILLHTPNVSAHKWLRKELERLGVKMAPVD